jgi:hypothetical protein
MLGGKGCVLIEATNYYAARNLIHRCLGSRWCFMYDNLNEVHINDRKILATIKETNGRTALTLQGL